jgi:hypothetical protein
VTPAGPAGAGSLVRPGVIALTPAEFLGWLRGELTEVRGVRLPPPWQPGQHLAFLGKTREGKTNLAVWLCSELRRYVLALDPKGMDESLSASGWERVSTVPGGAVKPAWRSDGHQQWERLQEDLAAGRPVRIIAGIESRTRAADAANRQLMGDAIEYARQTGGWTLLVDEHQVLSDPRMMGHGPAIARQAITAARDKTSLIINFQFLAWIEKAGVRQSTMIAMAKTRDRDLIKMAASAAGRPWQELAAAIDEFPKYWWLFISDEVRSPLIAVRPPKVT